jgi:hypothetical protein
MEWSWPSIPNWESPAYIESRADRKGSGREDKIGLDKRRLRKQSLQDKKFNPFQCLAKIRPEFSYRQGGFIGTANCPFLPGPPAFQMASSMVE